MLSRMDFTGTRARRDKKVFRHRTLFGCTRKYTLAFIGTTGVVVFTTFMETTVYVRSCAGPVSVRCSRLQQAFWSKYDWILCGFYVRVRFMRTARRLLGLQLVRQSIGSPHAFSTENSMSLIRPIWREYLRKIRRTGSELSSRETYRTERILILVLVWPTVEYFRDFSIFLDWKYDRSVAF